MKTFCAVFSLAFLAIGTYGQTYFTPQVSVKEVSLVGRNLEINSAKLSFQFTLENKGKGNIYVAVNPQQLFGKRGYYLNLGKENDALLEVSSCVYASPLYSPYTDKTMVELKLLKPGEQISECVFIDLPAKETEPPFDFPPSVNKQITSGNLKKIKLLIGFFSEEPGILGILKQRPLGPYVSGNDPVFSPGESKPKQLFEIQNLAIIELVREDSPDTVSPKIKE